MYSFFGSNYRSFSTCMWRLDQFLLTLYIFFFLLEVLVHGSAEATEHLKQHCLKHVCPHVYAPHIEETIDVTSDLCAYKV